mgnify:CR=1 FL=1
MKIGLYLILTLIFLECLDQSTFMIAVPSSPFSVGQLLFILTGFLNIKLKNLLQNPLVISFFIVNLLSLLAAYINPDFFVNISRSIGLFILFFASVGWIKYWNKHETYFVLNLFFITNYIYWAYYLINNVLINGELLSYGDLFMSNSSTINHHTLGLALSISSIFILVRFFIQRNKISVTGYAFILFTFLLLFVTESRSNSFTYTLGILLLIGYLHKISIKSIFLISFIGILVSLSFDYLLSSQEQIVQRFSFDSEYQTKTNVSRVQIYLDFPSEMYANPLGKGSVGGTKLIINDNYELNPHNQFLTYSLQSGIVGMLAIIYFLYKILIFVRKGSFLFVLRNKYLKATSMVSFVYLLTLMTIDIGGLLFQIILSFIFYLHQIFKIKSIGIK